MRLGSEPDGTPGRRDTGQRDRPRAHVIMATQKTTRDDMTGWVRGGVRSGGGRDAAIRFWKIKSGEKKKKARLASEWAQRLIYGAGTDNPSLAAMATSKGCV